MKLLTLLAPRKDLIVVTELPFQVQNPEHNQVLTALALLIPFFGFSAKRLLILIVFRHIHVSQRDTAAASGAVIVVVPQSHDGNA